jgi:succinate dehydrogenase / fumarate reductase cytochrome b subunit
VPKVKSEGPGRGAPATRGRWLRETWDSTVGKKVLVAISGSILLVYVVLHVLGNLKTFQGYGSGGAPVDDYAHFLRTVGSPVIPRDGLLWLVRVILIAALALHIAAITSLVRRNRAARPAGYPAPVVQRSLSSRTMAVSGVLVLAFIVFHILQFTTRTIQITPVYEGTVYANLDAAFSKWYFALLYVGAVILLGMHLKHAIWSVTQTAGWDKPNRNPTFRRFATGTAVAITVGFAAVPICFYTNILPDPPAPQVVAQR